MHESNEKPNFIEIINQPLPYNNIKDDALDNIQTINFLKVMLYEYFCCLVSQQDKKHKNGRFEKSNALYQKMCSHVSCSILSTSTISTSTKGKNKSLKALDSIYTRICNVIDGYWRSSNDMGNEEKRLTTDLLGLHREMSGIIAPIAKKRLDDLYKEMVSILKKQHFDLASIEKRKQERGIWEQTFSALYKKAYSDINKNELINTAPDDIIVNLMGNTHQSYRVEHLVYLALKILSQRETSILDCLTVCKDSQTLLQLSLMMGLRANYLFGEEKNIVEKCLKVDNKSKEQQDTQALSHSIIDAYLNLDKWSEDDKELVQQKLNEKMDKFNARKDNSDSEYDVFNHVYRLSMQDEMTYESVWEKILNAKFNEQFRDEYRKIDKLLMMPGMCTGKIAEEISPLIFKIISTPDLSLEAIQNCINEIYEKSGYTEDKVNQLCQLYNAQSYHNSKTLSSLAYEVLPDMDYHQEHDFTLTKTSCDSYAIIVQHVIDKNDIKPLVQYTMKIMSTKNMSIKEALGDVYAYAERDRKENKIHNLITGILDSGYIAEGRDLYDEIDKIMADNSIGEEGQREIMSLITGFECKLDENKSMSFVKRSKKGVFQAENIEDLKAIKEKIDAVVGRKVAGAPKTAVRTVFFERESLQTRQLT